MAELRSQFKIGLAAECADITSGNLITLSVNPSSYNTQLLRTNAGAVNPAQDGGFQTYANWGWQGREVGFLITFSGANAESDYDTFKETALHPDLKKLYVFGTSTSDSRYLIGQVYSIQETRSTTAPVKTIDAQVAFLAFDPCYYNDTEYTETLTLTADQSTSTTSVSLSGKMGTADSFFQVEVDPQGTADVSAFSIADGDLSGLTAGQRTDTTPGDAYNSAVDGQRLCSFGISGINPVANASNNFFVGSIDETLSTLTREFALVTSNPKITGYDGAFIKAIAGKRGTTNPYTSSNVGSASKFNINTRGS